MTWVENNDIKISEGDTLELQIKLVDDDGNAYTLATNDRIMFYIKKTYNSIVDALEPTEIPHTCILKIPAEKMRLLEPRDYVYEVRVEGTDIHTMLFGNFIVIPGVQKCLQ